MIFRFRTYFAPPLHMYTLCVCRWCNLRGTILSCQLVKLDCGRSPNLYDAYQSQRRLRRASIYIYRGSWSGLYVRYIKQNGILNVVHSPRNKTWCWNWFDVSYTLNAQILLSQALFSAVTYWVENAKYARGLVSNNIWVAQVCLCLDGRENNDGVL